MMPVSASRSSLIETFVPLLFVVLWSSGFIVARLVAPHADPLTFTCVRYVLVLLLLVPLALIQKAPWPRTPREIGANAVSGVLLHGMYLGGVFWAVKHGLPAGIAGLFSGLQPLVTALVAQPLLGERVGLRRWIGIVLGFAGAAIVLSPKLGMQPDSIPPISLGVAAIAFAAFTAGTIWQKRTGGLMDLRTGNVVQFSAALVPTAAAAFLLEEGRFDMTGELFAGLFWSVFGLSIGAVMLLLAMIRRGAVVKTASLLYLVPPVTALMAWIGFGETFTLLQLGGMVLAAIGVAIATRPEI
ncbi:DMT family transporter [Terrihabitans sp. B22-R8]|uniref:DMT family transporter n=1 Tax=Terrihabitans sp. B22-R8 TaxID=3425128 RepID=UPI00403C52F3